MEEPSSPIPAGVALPQIQKGDGSAAEDLRAFAESESGESATSMRAANKQVIRGSVLFGD